MLRPSLVLSSLALASLLASCVAVQNVADGLGIDVDLGGGPKTAAGAYDGAACDGDDLHVTMGGRPAPLRKSHERGFDQAAGGYVYSSRGGRYAEDPREQQVLQIICFHPIGRGGVAARDSAMVTDHMAFDDRRFDSLQAALMVGECDVMGHCRAGTDRVALGLMSLYAGKIDEPALAKQVEALALPQDAKGYFLARTKEARARVAAEAASLDPRRKHLYIEVPRAAMTARAALFKKHAPLYKKLDALLARSAVVQAGGDGDAKLVDELVALRGELMARCTGEDCRFHPLFTEITREVVVLHVLGRNELAALAEANLLNEEGADRNGFASSIYSAQVEALKKERAAWEDYTRLERDRAPPAILKAKFGKTPPIQVDADVAWWARDAFADVTAALDRQDYETAAGTVKGLVAEGANVKVLFADEVTEYDDADCEETNKVDYISNDGRIVYRQICRNHRTRTVRTKVDPVLVPKAEAAFLRPGELATMIVDRDSREGRLLTASAARKLKQVRAHRVR